MGYMRHHAIVATTWDVVRARRVRDAAVETGASVTEIVGSAINGFYTFMVGTDGSKEGWDEDEKGDERRDAIVKILRDDGYFKWVEVQYGDDEGVTEVCRHSEEHDED